MIITIDGGAGTGKTTVAAKVAEALNIHYFDTGALYRSFAWFCISQQIEAHDLPQILKILPEFTFSVLENGEKKQYFVGTEEVSSVIRSREVTAFSSHVSIFPEVRNELLKIQRDFAKNKDVVFEGRDLGTVVFPHAEVKIFLTADPVIRAKRRLAELKEKRGKEAIYLTEEEMRQEMEARDRADSERKTAPLRPPDDAYFIDTTELSIDQVVSHIMDYVKRKTR